MRLMKISYIKTMKAQSKIEKNGSKSCSKRSRHIDMRYVFIIDRLESEKIDVIFCPTEHMVADFFTKPLQGKLFHYLKAIVMGHKPIDTNRGL
jgi:hypothetical protein